MRLDNDISNRPLQPPASAAAAVRNRDVCRVDERHPRRRQVESFIARRFEQVHAARVTDFMPDLLAVFTTEGEVAAALGFRKAGSGPLYLEHYLERPVEQAIAACGGDADTLPRRERIIEIGNLASRDRRASRRLFASVAVLVAAQGFEWAVLTGGSALHAMFDRYGIETLILGRALQARLPADQQTWGSYYEDAPRVVAGRVDQGLQAFTGVSGTGHAAVAA